MSYYCWWWLWVNAYLCTFRLAAIWAKWRPTYFSHQSPRNESQHISRINRYKMKANLFLASTCASWRPTYFSHQSAWNGGQHITSNMRKILIDNINILHNTHTHTHKRLPAVKAIRTRYAGHCWRSKDKVISDVLLWTPSHGRTYTQQLGDDTGCSPEDLSEAINDREEWRERVRDIRAHGVTWWWWLKVKYYSAWETVYQIW